MITSLYKQELITLTKIRVQQFATSSISLLIGACINVSCFFSFLKPCSEMRQSEIVHVTSYYNVNW